MHWCIDGDTHCLLGIWIGHHGKEFKAQVQGTSSREEDNPVHLYHLELHVVCSKTTVFQKGLKRLQIARRMPTIGAAVMAAERGWVVTNSIVMNHDSWFMMNHHSWWSSVFSALSWSSHSWWVLTNVLSQRLPGREIARWSWEWRRKTQEGHWTGFFRAFYPSLVWGAH